MTVKRRVMVSLVWTSAGFVAGGLCVYYVMNHPVPGVPEKVAAERLGNVVGFVLTIGYAAIWLPYAFQVGQKRRAKRAKRG